MTGALYGTTPAAWQLSFNGLLFGAGCDVAIEKITGLRELPPIRSGDTPRPRRHGSFGGRNLYAERIIHADLLIAAPVNPIETVVAAVGAAFGNIETPDQLLQLQFMLPGWTSPRWLLARPTKGGYPIDVGYQAGYIKVPVELTCQDALIYDTAWQTVTTGIGSPAAGLAFPAAFPASFGQNMGGGLRINNIGNEATPPQFTIFGPMTNPRLSLGSAFLGFQVTLATNDQLYVDTGEQVVLINGVPRLDVLQTGSSFFWLPTGVSYLSASSSDQGKLPGIVQVKATSAWGWC